MNRKRIYLDYNATTPCAPEVIEAMLPFLAGEYANPDSPHAMGRAAAAAVAAARQQVAELVDCDPDQIVFTSGATESNNIALFGVAAASSTRRKIITTAVEHKSILAPCERLAEMGFEIVRLPVDRDGVVDVDTARDSIDDDTLLVSIQAANNETGTIQPVEILAGRARARGSLVHSDCAQVLGKVPLSMPPIGVHYASFSAHKMYGPKGVGALFVRDHVSRSLIAPRLFGGGQEGGLRPGTPNVPAIVGFGAAGSLAGAGLTEEGPRLAGLRDCLEREIRAQIPSVTVNGAVNSRLPGTTNLTFRGIPSDTLIARAGDLCISDGSACASGAPAPSHVLRAMGLPESDADSTIRISVGRGTCLLDVSHAVRVLVDTVSGLRTALGLPLCGPAGRSDIDGLSIE